MTIKVAFEILCYIFVFLVIASNVNMLYACAKENKEKFTRCFEKSLKSAILIFIILGIAFISYKVSEYITGIFF